MNCGIKIEFKTVFISFLSGCHLDLKNTHESTRLHLNKDLSTLCEAFFYTNVFCRLVEARMLKEYFKDDKSGNKR